MSKKILIVDDDEDVSKVLQFRLEMKGFEIETCPNGGLALDRITQNEYDLVLLDYFMPSLKGDAVCQSVRSFERLKNLPLVIMTAFNHYPVEFFTEKGATDVVYKPYEPDELVEKIRKLTGE